MPMQCIEFSEAVTSGKHVREIFTPLNPTLIV